MRACAAACVHPQSFLSTTRSSKACSLTRERYMRVRTHDTRVNEVTSGVDAWKEERRQGIGEGVERKRRDGDTACETSFSPAFITRQPRQFTRF